MERASIVLSDRQLRRYRRAALGSALLLARTEPKFSEARIIRPGDDGANTFTEARSAVRAVRYQKGALGTADDTESTR